MSGDEPANRLTDEQVKYFATVANTIEPDDVIALAKEVLEARELLRGLEWVGPYGCCQVCLRSEATGHKRNCQLALAIGARRREA